MPKPPPLLPLILALLMLLLAACGPGSDLPAQPTSGGLQLAPVFREFYRNNGGQAVFGPPVTSLLQTDDAQCQYTENTLLLTAPQGESGGAVVLAPLGAQMDVAEPSVPAPTDPNARYLNGHIIDPEFVPLFDQLGVEIVGLPLSESHQDPERRRLIQYFTNMGFYHLDDDPPGLVYPLSYGLWRCSEPCRAAGPLNLGPASSTPPTFETQWIAYLERFNPALLGEPLGPLTPNAAGVVTQVFAHVALTADPQAPDGVRPLPLPELLGLPAEVLVPQSDDPQLAFYASDGQLGHNVFIPFQNYLADASGFELSGPPISEPRLQPDGSLRQCFRHLCLEYRPDAAPDAQIQPVALGVQYLAAQPPAPAPPLTLTVQAAAPALPSGAAQEITVSVSRDGAPLANLEPLLLLTLADGAEQPYPLPPTDGLGQTRVTLQALVAPPSTVFRYRACLTTPEFGQVCSPTEQFVIWNEP